MTRSPLRLALGSLALAATACTSPGAAVAPHPERPAVVHYNLGRGALALEGYDPVSYFPEGGGEPQPGDADRSLTLRGVTYRFASDANLEAFRAAPGRYEPAYGGWCAWAMVDGEQVDVDPRSYLIEDGRLLLFYDGWLGDTRARWMRGDRAALEAAADASWRATAGEAPPER